MTCDSSQGNRFGLSWRRVLIAVVYLGLLAGVILPFLESLKRGLGLDAPLAAVLISFPLLAFLVMLLDRPGPVRNWAVRLLLFSSLQCGYRSVRQGSVKVHPYPRPDEIRGASRESSSSSPQRDPVACVATSGSV